MKRTYAVALVILMLFGASLVTGCPAGGTGLGVLTPTQGGGPEPSASGGSATPTASPSTTILATGLNFPTGLRIARNSAGIESLDEGIFFVDGFRVVQPNQGNFKHVNASSTHQTPVTFTLTDRNGATEGLTAPLEMDENTPAGTSTVTGVAGQSYFIGDRFTLTNQGRVVEICEIDKGTGRALLNDLTTSGAPGVTTNMGSLNNIVGITYAQASDGTEFVFFSEYQSGSNPGGRIGRITLGGTPTARTAVVETFMTNLAFPAHIDATTSRIVFAENNSTNPRYFAVDLQPEKADPPHPLPITPNTSDVLVSFTGKSTDPQLMQNPFDVVVLVDGFAGLNGFGFSFVGPSTAGTNGGSLRHSQTETTGLSKAFMNLVKGPDGGTLALTNPVGLSAVYDSTADPPEAHVFYLESANSAATLRRTFFTNNSDQTVTTSRDEILLNSLRNPWETDTFYNPATNTDIIFLTDGSYDPVGNNQGSIIRVDAPR
ncbi:MAG TPA: hypothetical protein VNO81_00775 [Candidatus Nitrosotenuis sp.]|jgi:hypothetical protein|nr:hypothetical protein [Candidatus Nitrosotenuis sp.]